MKFLEIRDQIGLTLYRHTHGLADNCQMLSSLVAEGANEYGMYLYQVEMRILKAAAYRPRRANQEKQPCDTSTT